MSTQGLRLFAFFLGVLGITGGCAGVPPVPSNVAPPPPRAASKRVEEDDEGWLFKRLTGRGSESSPGDTRSEVVPASATEPVASSPSAPAATKTDEDDDGFDLSDLAPENVWKDLKKAAGYGPNEGVARALFKEGETLYEQKKYSEAGGKFKSAAGRWPDSILEEDALFMQGKCYLLSDQYPKAQDTYENLLKKYDNSRHLDEVVRHLFSIGQYWEKLHEVNSHWPITPNLTDKEQPRFDTFGNALKCYETVRMKDPTGPLADDSVMATANAYFRKGRFEDAAFHYDILRKEYPNSEHQAQAHVLGLQSKLRVYQGASYDRTPLEEAEKIAEQTLTQFQSELGGERARVAQTRDRILEQKAERDWAKGQYYDNRKQFGAARFYYRSVVKNYPLTQAAGRARDRLEQIRNEPDTPPNRFRWLTDVFEPNDTKKRPSTAPAPLQRMTDNILRPNQHLAED